VRVRGLARELREVVACRYLLELSDAETAAALRIPAGTVNAAAPRVDDLAPTSTTPTVADGTSAADCTSAADGTSTAAAITAPGRPILSIVAAGLGGLVVGALGALLVLRPRAARGSGVTPPE